MAILLNLVKEDMKKTAVLILKNGLRTVKTSSVIQGIHEVKKQIQEHSEHCMNHDWISSEAAAETCVYPHTTIIMLHVILRVIYVWTCYLMLARLKNNPS